MVARVLLSVFLLLGAVGFGCVAWMMAGEEMWPGAVITFGFSAVCLAAGIFNLLFEKREDLGPSNLLVPGLGERFWILSQKENPICYDVVLLTEKSVKVRKRAGWLETSVVQRLRDARGDMNAVLRDKWTREIPYESIDQLELDSLNKLTTICYHDRNKRRHRLRTSSDPGMFQALGAALGDGYRLVAHDMRATDVARIPLKWLMMTLLTGYVFYNFSLSKHLRTTATGRTRIRQEIIHHIARFMPPTVWLVLTVLACISVLIWLIHRLVWRPKIQVISACATNGMCFSGLVNSQLPGENHSSGT